MSVSEQATGPERSVAYKQVDQSVTEADQLSNEYILSRLTDLPPIVPVISEESDVHILPDSCRQFWLVDPLDGTKEFLKGSGEFTINITLIQDGTQILGFIDVPAFQETYFGGQDIDFSVVRNQLGKTTPDMSSTMRSPSPYVISFLTHKEYDDPTNWDKGVPK